MIVFIEAGRFGNQLFQYAALRTLIAESGEGLVLVGFSELASVFDGVDATILGVPRIGVRVLMRYREQLDAICVKLPPLGIVGSAPGEPKRAVKIRHPRYGGLSYGTMDWFDSGNAFTLESIASLRIKAPHTSWAEDALARHGAAVRPKIFVHVRRGDYLHWPTADYPAVLPLSWYRHAMALMRERYGEPLFVLVSDDVPYVREHFGDTADCHIAAGGLAQDFALMTLCDGGILSASTFSWWGALFAARRNRDATFLGPRNWDQHRLGKGGELQSPHHLIDYVDTIPFCGPGE